MIASQAAEASADQTAQRPLRICLAGNPNSGKSTLFNSLTGLRQKVANYPGVTVEKKTGSFDLDGRMVDVTDLPGTYSLAPQSPDEEIARDVLFNWRRDVALPDVVVVVVDATNLQRNLYLATQIMELGLPMVLALNMSDLAAARGLEISTSVLRGRLGIPVVNTVANRKVGIEELKASLLEARPGSLRFPLHESVQRAVDRIAPVLTEKFAVPGAMTNAIALRLVCSPHGEEDARLRWGDEGRRLISEARESLKQGGGSLGNSEATARYQWIREVLADAVTGRAPQGTNLSDRVDRVLTHPISGLICFAAIMSLVFQSIFTWARPLMDGISDGAAHLGDLIQAHMTAGILTDLLANGVLAGVGAAVAFLPQISFLFFFLAVLEDSGYLARPAFAMDNIMHRAGLSGRSLIPLLSSFACAIPGIMSTRIISNKNDRLVTILIAPLMTCSARLPVYALMIAAFVPAAAFYGMAPMLVMLALYFLGIAGALIAAFAFKRTLLKGTITPLMLELPPYRWPSLGKALREAWERSLLFLKTAGTIILYLSILLWFLAAFPRIDTSQAAAMAEQQVVKTGDAAADKVALEEDTSKVASRLQLEGSYMGHLGRGFEPVVRPLGFDWKIGVGLVACFAAREVMVSTMSILYEEGNKAEQTPNLITKLKQAQRPDGSPVFTGAVVGSLLVFFVFACQCMSTVAIVARETNGWKWPSIMVAYMMVFAYVGSFVTYHGLQALGFGG